MMDLICLFFLFLPIFLGLDAKNNGYCIGTHCFVAFQDPVDFATAKKHCENKNGQLMTVRSSVSHNIISGLLSIKGDYWIGLHLPSGRCPDSASGLRGFSWITGDNATDFENWGVVDEDCSSKCVSVSKEEFKWTEKSCNIKIDGYLCEYTFPSVCKRFDINVGETVWYETPLGFQGGDFLVLPMGSIATRNPFEFKYICLSDQWTPAPWDCQVFNGGCENECLTIEQKQTCICTQGKTLHYNKRSCEVAQNDPCLNSGCSHVCHAENDTSVACTCPHGYALTEDGKQCKDIDDCVTGNQCPGQNYECVNTIGSFQCRCRDGFEMMNDVCNDRDECENGPCEQQCMNLIGSYNCSCFDGYVAAKDPHKCQLYCPYVECLAECDPNEALQCNCPEGYLVDVRNEGTFCLDIDECDMDACDHICKNTFGGHICSCNKGYDLFEGWKCLKKEPSDFTTPSVFISPTTTYSTQRPSVVTPGGLLAIIVCTVVVVLFLVFLVHHVLKRCCISEVPSAPKTQRDHGHNLEKVMMEK